jgi:excisionase family DNA binding protein
MSDTSISLADAADQLGVHYMTAYRYVRTGGITAPQVDGRWLIAPSELDRFRHTPRARPGRRPRRTAATVESNRVDRLVSCAIGDRSEAGLVIESSLVARQLGADGWSASIDDVVAWFVELAPGSRERRR